MAANEGFNITLLLTAQKITVGDFLRHLMNRV